MTKPEQKQTWFSKRFVQPVLTLLKQGLTPEKVALALAVGAVLGVFPALGTTTLLCALAGMLLGLNQVALQTANALVYPLQLVLLIPFYQVSAVVFGLDSPVDNLSELTAMISQGIWHTIAALWEVGWRSWLLWAALALPLGASIYYPMLPLLRGAAKRFKQMKGTA